MSITHRKLLPEQDFNQTTDCSDCGPTCPDDCDYATIYWPPQFPPSSTTSQDSAATHISPYLIVIVAMIGSAILFISYYLIMIRYCARLRQPSATQVNEDFDHGPEIDHPIWYITTIGLQPAQINSITVVKFKEGENLIEGTDCSVCLSAFKDDESLRLLPKCNHAFHIPCIDTWLRSHTNCPLCRAAVLSSNSNTCLINDQNTQMEFPQTDGGLGSNRLQENRETGRVEVEGGSKEIQDSKTEYENIITLRRSISMDSAAEIVLTEPSFSNSNHRKDSRTERLMMMRSFSYGGRSIIYS